MEGILAVIVCRILEVEVVLKTILSNCFILEVKKEMLQITQVSKSAKPRMSQHHFDYTSGLQSAFGYAPHCKKREREHVLLIYVFVHLFVIYYMYNYINVI